MEEKDLKKIFKGELIFNLVGSIKPYDIYIRGKNSDIDFKNSEGTMFASREALYYVRQYECSVLIFDTYLVVDNAENHSNIQKFIIGLLEMDWIEVSSANTKFERKVEKLYV